MGNGEGLPGCAPPRPHHFLFLLATGEGSQSSNFILLFQDCSGSSGLLAIPMDLRIHSPVSGGIKRLLET